METGGRNVSITVRHNDPSNIHYVSEIEVKVGEDSTVIELDPQSGTSFIEQVMVADSGSVEVRVFCTLHGWSSWVSLEVQEPVEEVTTHQPSSEDESSGGIPGFPLMSILIGFAVTAVILWFTQRRQ